MAVAVAVAVAAVNFVLGGDVADEDADEDADDEDEAWLRSGDAAAAFGLGASDTFILFLVPPSPPPPPPPPKEKNESLLCFLAEPGDLEGDVDVEAEAEAGAEAGAGAGAEAGTGAEGEGEGRDGGAGGSGWGGGAPSLRSPSEAATAASLEGLGVWHMAQAKNWASMAPWWAYVHTAQLQPPMAAMAAKAVGTAAEESECAAVLRGSSAMSIR